eukprot:3652044-Pyramimonas_sp.AAC.1
MPGRRIVPGSLRVRQAEAQAPHGCVRRGGRDRCQLLVGICICIWRVSGGAAVCTTAACTLWAGAGT